MDQAKVAQQLTQYADIFEVYHKTSFECYRHTKDGGIQTVTVDILDMGPEKGDLRYTCVAKSEDGRMATGNPARSVDEVLPTVHWFDLDRDAI